jgi:predicted DNA-binding transcriptional regulator AlpA
MDTPTNSVLLTVRDVAKKLSASIRTVWRYSSDGRIPRPVKIGRLSRWRPEEIERCIHPEPDHDALDTREPSRVGGCCDTPITQEADNPKIVGPSV